MSLVTRQFATPCRRYTGRARAGIAVILLMGALAVCTLASYYRVVTRGRSRDPDGIVMDEERFTGIRAALPQRGTIGYLGDAGGKRENARAYYLTQYFLAPVVVAPDSAHELVVANFSSRSAMAVFAASHGFTVENDFWNGVALLRRRSP